MRILSKKNYLLLGCTCFLGTLPSFAQEPSNSSEIDSILNNFIAQDIVFEQPEATVIINQDPRIERLSKIKAEMEKDGAFSDRYKIQLYNGSLTEANNIKNKAKLAFPQWKTEILYETPNHKVWIGNYRTKLETDRALKEIRNEFPSAFPFQPEKR